MRACSTARSRSSRSNERKEITGADRVPDFDQNICNEAFDLGDHLKLFDEVDVAGRLQLADRGVRGPDAGGFRDPFRSGPVSGAGRIRGMKEGQICGDGDDDGYESDGGDQETLAVHRDAPIDGRGMKARFLQGGSWARHSGGRGRGARALPSLMAQGLDRVQPGGAYGRVKAEKEPAGGADADGGGEGGRLDEDDQGEVRA